MISTYEEYLPMEKSLSIEDMVKLHNEMVLEIGSDSDALELYDELVETATRYAAFRAKWPLMSKEEKMDTDPSQSTCHNSLIVKFNQLARYLKMQGKTASWRDTLGYEEDDKYNRKRIGDFSCYIVFINSISSR
ncbi:hypothetical protein DW886_03675 [Enterocloster aldenensis]|uniref:hypothetical protein n=1 Tax=Enterocloster aldenensis TaxID=358742 RepID=UPI000E4734C7|nr:hypothetical protein DW886_03675 [Enterocloster aldenensis]